MTRTERRKSEIIDANINRAQTLPSEYYREQKYFDLSRERIFARSWQFSMAVEQLPPQGSLLPWTFLEGHVNEPLVFTRDLEDRVHCLSNVCTHRGNILVESACAAAGMRCRYHGRRFSPTGEFFSAPGFEGAEDFPSPAENLPSAQLALWGNFQFVAIDPVFDFSQLIIDMNRRLHWLPFDKMKLMPEFSRDYHVDANWALYVDNYLEGLHVPFVHPALTTVLDTKDYRNEVHSYSNLQIGLASNHNHSFHLPNDSPEAGNPVAAYYYFLFPNMAFNFYPWGVSINIVMPMAIDKTCVRYLTYVYDESRLESYSPSMLEQTEYEDEEIVQMVQKGIQSRMYKGGRYSPSWDLNLHHFHKLLTAFLTE